MERPEHGAPAPQIKTINELIDVLNALPDARRLAFARQFDVGSLQSAGTRWRPRTEVEDLALAAFSRLGDGTLEIAEQLALEGRSGHAQNDAVLEAVWYEGATIVEFIAAALADDDRQRLDVLQPAMTWLETAARATDA